MQKHKITGKKGELAAREFLEKNNYEILDTNWRFKKAEIDIIARDLDEDILVFFEVKTRTYDYFGDPADFVTERKKHLMLDAASQYMKKINYDWAIRFDIIGILWKDDNNVTIRHYKDAFFM